MREEYQGFVDKLDNFLVGNSHVAAIRGINDHDKLGLTLAVLDKQVPTLNGTIMTNGVTRLRELMNETFGGHNLTGKVGNLQQLGKMKVNVEKYSSPGTVGYDEHDFSLYYPVESALFIPKDTINLRKHISGSRAKKVIILTTNDFHGWLESIRDLIDEDIILDTSKAHPKEYQTVIENLQREGRNLDY